MKKLFYLSTCDTCKRLMKSWDLPEEVELQDIKKQSLLADELHQLKKLAGSYEALFSRRARLYKERNLGAETLSEEAIRDLLLEHYSFLKRPVLVWENHIFIGNAQKNAEEVQSLLARLS